MAYWPDTGTGVDTQPARKPVQSATRKYFSEGGIGQPPTVPGGDWFNQMTNEVLNVLVAAGIAPNKDDDEQLLAAINVLSDSGLRGDLASQNGADLVFNGALPVSRYIGDKLICRPVGNPAGDKAALLDAAAAAAATGMTVHLLKGDTFTLDNSEGPGIIFAQDDFKLSGLGRIVATSDTNDLVVTTGARALIHKGVKVQGPGTHRPDLGGTGNPPSLIKMTGDDSFCRGVLFIEPYTSALFIKGASGGMDRSNTILCSYAGSIAQSFIFGIYYRTIADRIAMGNVIDGCIQGICGGGDGSGLLTVTCKDGLVTSNLRNITVTMNTCVNQLDHSIYFSNNTEDISILHNKGLTSVNDLIKIEGGPNHVIGNTGKGGSCITGRNVFKTRISGNIMTSTLDDPNFAYGILLYEQQFKRPIFDVEIDSNQLTHEGSQSKAAIYVLGDVWGDQSYQSVISSLNIHHNKARGYGNSPEGLQILVRQKTFDTNPVTGSMASIVNIDHNDCVFPPHAHAGTVGIEVWNISGGSAIGNNLSGFRSIGIRKIGAQDFNDADNTLTPAAGATALAGIYERPKDQAVHFDSKRNKSGPNTYVGAFSRQVLHSDETDFNFDRVIIVNNSNVSTGQIIASQWAKQVVFTGLLAGAVLTIDAVATSPWPINSDLTVTNAGTNSFTVNPGGYVVPAGTSLRLIGIGNNNWVKAT
jgi:hypothetical protein